MLCLYLMLMTLCKSVYVNTDTNTSNYKLKQKDKKAINHVNALLGDVHKQILESRLILTTLNDVTKHTDLTRILQQPGIERKRPNNTKADKNKKTRYLSTAFTSLVEDIGIKHQAEVVPVLQYAEQILKESPTQERITWMGEPMTSVVTSAAHGVKTNYIKFETIARILYFMLTHREEQIKKEVSDIIDMADDIVTPRDGQNMLELVEDFKIHPYGLKQGHDLCYSLIEAFERPFTKLVGNRTLNKLVMLANKAFLKSYPELERYVKGNSP